jgi:hypothetical protein
MPKRTRDLAKREAGAVTGGSGQAATRKELPCPTPL